MFLWHSSGQKRIPILECARRPLNIWLWQIWSLSQHHPLVFTSWTHLHRLRFHSHAPAGSWLCNEYLSARPANIPQLTSYYSWTDTFGLFMCQLSHSCFFMQHFTVETFSWNHAYLLFSTAKDSYSTWINKLFVIIMMHCLLCFLIQYLNICLKRHYISIFIYINVFLW